MAVSSLVEPPDDCPDLLYRDDQRSREAPKLDKMVGSIRSDLARYEKTREFLGNSEVIALRRFRIDQFEDSKKTYHLDQATVMAGRLLGTALGGAATLGFLYVGGGLATVKRIVKDAAKKTLKQYVMQNPTLAVATAYRTARWIPGKTGKVIAIGTCATVAAKSGLDMIAAVDASYHGVLEAGTAMGDDTVQQEAAATACTAAVIIASGDKKKAARAFLPRIKKMCGVEAADTAADKTFMACAQKGMKKAAAAETKQLLTSMRIGSK